MPVGDLAPEIAVLLTAVATLLAALALPHRAQALCATVALGGLAVAAVLCARQLGGEARLAFSGVWAVDGASVWARLAILGVAAATVGLMPGWFATDRRHGEAYAMLLFACLGAMAMAGAADLIQLVMAVLLSSVTGYALAAWHRDWPLSVEAGMKYFLVGALANAVLTVGVTLVFGMAAATGYGPLGQALGQPGAASPLLGLGAALVVVGLAFKLAAVPAHAWMPDVAEGAPAPMAAFLTVAPKVGAAVALARLVALFPAEEFALRPLVAAIAAATMTLGNLAAIGQRDVRRLLGWSAVSQSGYALMAVAVVGLAPEAMPALLLFLAAYALANTAAFAAIAHLRGRTDLADFAGLAARRPVSVVMLAVALLSLVGIPPLAGFVGKLRLFEVTIAAGLGWLAVVAALNTVVSLYYYLRVLGPATFAAPNGPVAVLDRPSAAATGVAALGTLAAGLAAGPLVAGMSGATLLP
jgi:NADH-quinone oxidoreductase subunit N